MLKLGELMNLAEKTDWVLDVDDCLYEIDCGLHDYIRGNIAQVFNHIVQNTCEGDRVVNRLQSILDKQELSVANIRNISPNELGVAFPPIVRAIGDIMPGRLAEYLSAFYGDEYYRIEPDRHLLDAFLLARQKGIRVHFYTNGPSGSEAGVNLHLQKVLKRRGLDEAHIEELRPFAYDLIKAVRAGRGKPTTASMQDFLEFSGINPATAFMADDSLKNLQTAAEAGLSTLWTWTTEKDAKPEDQALAKKIGAPQVRNTGFALSVIAEVHNPIKAQTLQMAG